MYRTLLRSLPSRKQWLGNISRRDQYQSLLDWASRSKELGRSAELPTELLPTYWKIQSQCDLRVALLGGEEALLGLGYFMEPSSGFFIRSWHYIFPQLSWGILRYRHRRRQEASRIPLFLQGFTGTPSDSTGSIIP